MTHLADVRYWPTDTPPVTGHPLIITWDGVGVWPADNWPADNWPPAIADAEAIYCDLATDADDPGYVRPEMTWKLAWHRGQRRRLTLRVNGELTSIHIDERSHL